MPPRKMKDARLDRIDVTVTPLQKEFVLRASWDLKMNQAEFLRTGRMPDSPSLLEKQVKYYREKQKKEKGVLGPIE